MSVEEVSLYFLGGVPIQYYGLDPIDPRSSFDLMTTITFYISIKTINKSKDSSSSDKSMTHWMTLFL